MCSRRLSYAFSDSWTVVRSRQLSCALCDSGARSEPILYIRRLSYDLEDSPECTLEDFHALSLACVDNVTVGFSSGLKHFSLFERAKIGARAKKVREGRREETFLFLASPSASPPFP